MADYSNFPFGDFTVAEIFALMRESKDIGDTEFVDACREAIRLNKCRPTPLAVDSAYCACQMFFDDGRNDPPVCEFCGKPQSRLRKPLGADR